LTQEFVHLRVHSEYSIADSIIKIKMLAAETAERNMPAVALTDRSSLFGLIKFYQAAVSSGIKPIIGVDLRYQPQRSGDEVSDDYRIAVLAMNATGYKNLLSLVSRAYVGDVARVGEHGLVREEDVFSLSEGLLVLSGATDGEIGAALARDDSALADAVATRWAQAFPGRFYVELVRTGRAGEDRYVVDAVKLAERTGLPVVATNDVVFLDTDDFEAHETRVCIYESRTLDDPRRERRYSAEQYLRTPQEMAELFADVPEALANSVEIARRCNVHVELGTYHLPNYPVPDGSNLESFLETCANDGLSRRLEVLDAEGVLAATRDAYQQRLDYELAVINQMGFPGYFLIVMEFIAWAKEHDIPVGPGRGSGAGSLVAYALGITDLDPLRYDLLFERFLNPERVSMPDFDVDFCMEGRDRVISHVSERYGQEAVSQIITFGTMAARAVVKDVARVQGKPYGLADKLSKLIPFEVGMTLTKAVAETAELRDFIASSEEVAEIMDMAYALEGIVRGLGRHAGGVVIAPSALTNFVPLYADDQSGGLVSQFDKDDVESAGLVKFDFLGLKTLTIIDWAVHAINDNRGPEESVLDIDKIPLDDPATYTLLKDAETTGVFQLESRGMRDLIRGLKPDNINDIIALVALFRPGPLQSGADADYISRKHGREPVVIPHPSTEAALRGTYGVMLYQEQVMQIAQDMAGFTLGQADLLRRAMGKKKPEEMAKVRQQFLDGCEKRKVDRKIADAIFDDMEKFSGYAFNKSHSATYAVVSFQTAWLKCHYPAEFMAANLSADMQNIDKVVTLVDEVRAMELHLQPPSVNLSRFRFTAQDGGVVYGLGAVRGVGEGPVAAIVEDREAGGPYRSLADLCRRIDARKLNRRVLEALIRSGALDEFALADESIDQVRARLLTVLPEALQWAEQLLRNEDAGIADIFGGTIEEPDLSRSVAAMSKRDRLEGEKDTLGLYLTGHPIEDYLGELGHFCSQRIAHLKTDSKNQLVAGLVYSIRTMRSRRGDMAFVVIDDRSGRIEASLFSDVYERLRDKVVKDAIMVFEGEVQVDEYSGAQKLRVENAFTMAEARRKYARGLQINLRGDGIVENLPTRLKSCLEPHRQRDAGCAVALLCEVDDQDLQPAAGRVVLGASWRVNPSDELLSRLKHEFGTDRVALDYSAS
jgi:DNA polymerase-3 subunit alpha